MVASSRAGYANHQAGRGEKAVVRAENRGTQPPEPRDLMCFRVHPCSCHGQCPYVGARLHQVPPNVAVSLATAGYKTEKTIKCQGVSSEQAQVRGPSPRLPGFPDATE